MVGGRLFVPFTVVLSVVPSSVGELKNIGQFNGIYTHGYEQFLSAWYTDLRTSKGECAYHENAKDK